MIKYPRIFFISLSVLFSSVSFSEESKVKTYDIEFGGVSKIKSHTKFSRELIEQAFPKYRVVESDVFTYGETRKGFLLFSGQYEEPIYRIYPEANKNYIFAIFSNSIFVRGPKGATIGSTKLSEMKDMPEWEFCGWGLNDLENTYLCYGSGVRVLFEAPKGYDREFNSAPQSIIDNGVLSEVMYWPGSP